jgi:hypothetical protein
MGLTSEIYLTKKFVSKDEWLELINIISNYNGIFRKWKIIITNDRNQIRYFVKTRCSLPATLNNLNSFLLKPTKEIKAPKINYTLLSLPKLDSSIIDLINYSEIKNKGTLEYLEINFLKLCEDKIKSKIKFYLNKNGIIKKYNVIFAIPTSILSTDFEGNKRYFYRSCPKYLEINKILHLLNTDSNNALLSVDTFPYLQGNFYLNQNSFSFDKHSIIIGSSGCGKSKFISLLINNINKNESLKQKYKIVVIDPHAALENDIGGIGKVIDFKSNLDSIDLFINNNDDIVASTELLLDLLKSLISDQYNSKLERVLRHSIHLLLTGESFNFRNLRKLILDLEYRNNLIKKLKYNLPVSVIDFFLSDFNDLKTKSYGEAISPIIGFIDEMEMIPVFNSEQDSENLKNTINNNFLTLFSLDRTKLGDKVTKTISGLIMQQLLTIIQKKEIDKHIIFIIDEVAVVENLILSRYLSEARKYNLSLILAGQYFNQISDELKNSIFANVINYFIFRVSKLDANVLVDNFNMKIPLDDSRDRKIKLLTELNNRECIVRIDSYGVLLPAFKGITLDYTSIPRIKRIITDDNNIENSNNMNKSKTNFSLNSNVSLKDILISNSTSKKGM